MELVFRVHVVGDATDDQKLRIQRTVYQQLMASAAIAARDTYKLILQEDNKLCDLELDSMHEVALAENDNTLDDGVAGYVDNHILFVHRKRKS